MTRAAKAHAAAYLALLPLAAGLSWALSGGLQKKEIVFGCAIALFHGFSIPLLNRKAIGYDTQKFLLWGVAAPVYRAMLTASLLGGIYLLAGLSRPDVFLAAGLAGVLCLQAGAVLALHFKSTE
ncbi:MAG: hypothetical protein U1F77_01235 [Kiritimatiellia bacterium]